MSQAVRIALIGFDPVQAQRLGRILERSRNHPYQMVPFDPEALPDLALVNGRELLEQEPVRSLPPSFRARLILVTNARDEESSLPRLGFPFIASRVLNTLDRIISIDEELDVADTGEAAPAPDRLEAARAPRPGTSRGRYRVLIVEDSRPMQEALIDQLHGQFPDMEIDTADNGEAGLDRVRQQEYDFIFLDVVMPGMDGFEVCERMRALPKLKKTPIIMLTSRTSPLDEVRGIMSGSTTYLTKPIRDEEFRKVMARITRWIDEFSGRPRTAATEESA